MTPTESLPYLAWISLKRRAVKPIASSQDTTRQGSWIESRIIGFEQALAMGRVAIGEAALDAAMAVIGLAVLPGHHAHDFLAAHFSLEGAADAAIGAGGHRGMLGLADVDHRFLGQRRGRAGLHAGAAGDAFGFEEGFRHARRHAAVETAAADRQREGALHLLAGAHAAIADDALRRIIGEIGVRIRPSASSRN